MLLTVTEMIIKTIPILLGSYQCYIDKDIFGAFIAPFKLFHAYLAAFCAYSALLAFGLPNLSNISIIGPLTLSYLVSYLYDLTIIYNKVEMMKLLI